MAIGTLEVLLVGAKIKSSTFFCGSKDPYAIMIYRDQEKKSSVKSAKGTDPEWNETFLFTITPSESKIRIKFMDKDGLTRDDLIGETVINLEKVLVEGKVPQKSYKIKRDKKVCGEVTIGLVFFPHQV